MITFPFVPTLSLLFVVVPLLSVLSPAGLLLSSFPEFPGFSGFSGCSGSTTGAATTFTVAVAFMLLSLSVDVPALNPLIVNVSSFTFAVSAFAVKLSTIDFASSGAAELANANVKPSAVFVTVAVAPAFDVYPVYSNFYVS